MNNSFARVDEKAHILQMNQFFSLFFNFYGIFEI